MKEEMPEMVAGFEINELLCLRDALQQLGFSNSRELLARYKELKEQKELWQEKQKQAITLAAKESLCLDIAVNVLKRYADIENWKVIDNLGYCSVSYFDARNALTLIKDKR